MKLSLLPGLALTFGIAAIAVVLHSLPFVGVLSALIIAIAIGVLVRNTVGTPAAAQPGVTFTLKKILRLAIVLLGLQLSLQQVKAVGLTGVAIIIFTLVATFVFTQWAGKRLGVNAKLSQLIAAGTSICGASAVIATNTVTEGRDEDVAYAVALVTVFGSIGMFLYPLFPSLLHLTPQAFGLWAGSSIHEIAQVVAAAFQDGKAAGDFATISKLTRVAMLAPVVLTLGWLGAMKRRGEDGATFDASGIPIPWFVFGFIGVMLLNSFGIVPAGVKSVLLVTNQYLLAAALAAMGLETSIGKLRAEGLRPFALGALATAFISTLSLTLVHFVYR